MPELPEVEASRLLVNKLCSGKLITEAEALEDDSKHMLEGASSTRYGRCMQCMCFLTGNDTASLAPGLNIWQVRLGHPDTCTCQHQ
jgi:hypothetical protein